MFRAPPLTSEEARQQARAEGLTLRVSDNKTGYYGVSLTYPAGPRPYQAQGRHGGKTVHLDSFATAEEAALCIARSSEGRAAEVARQQARAEGLTLLKAENSTGYFGVYLCNPDTHKPYQAKVRHGGKEVYLGIFGTAEEAALSIARSPKGQEAAKRAAAAAPQLSEEDGKGTVPPMPPGAFVKEEDVPAAAVVKEEGAVPPMPPGAFVKEEDVPAAAVVKEEGAVPPMPPDAFVVKTEAVVKEEQCSGSRPKRQRRK